MKVTKNNKYILAGYRNANDGLWDVPLRTHPNPKASIKVNYIYPRPYYIYPKRSQTALITKPPPIIKKINN